MVAGHTKPPRLGPSCINATGMSPAAAFYAFRAFLAFRAFRALRAFRAFRVFVALPAPLCAFFSDSSAALLQGLLMYVLILLITTCLAQLTMLCTLEDVPPAAKSRGCYTGTNVIAHVVTMNNTSRGQNLLGTLAEQIGGKVTCRG